MKMMTMRVKIKKKEKKVKNRRVHNNLMMMMARMTTSLGLLIKIWWITIWKQRRWKHSMVMKPMMMLLTRTRMKMVLTSIRHLLIMQIRRNRIRILTKRPNLIHPNHKKAQQPILLKYHLVCTHSYLRTSMKKDITKNVKDTTQLMWQSWCLQRKRGRFLDLWRSLTLHMFILCKQMCWEELWRT